MAGPAPGLLEPRSTNDTPERLIGQSIGDYRIMRLIGQGGMGAVYEARRPDGNRVAVKFLYEKFTADRENVRRFVNEARTAIRVRHPNLVEMFESGELPSGLPYVMMELLDGETLGSRLERLTRLPVLSALHIASEVAAALAVAHSRGIVHRDLKPDNIFLALVPGGKERVKVLDFGVAKILTPPDGSMVTVVRTKTGSIVGTPAYMSPEQCRGAERVRDRSDVYSLGLVLYEMLAGHPPFVGDSPGELLVKHILDEPPPLARMAPDVPRDIAALVHHLLQKQPSSRPDMHTLHKWLAALSDPKAPRPELPFLQKGKGRRLQIGLGVGLAVVTLSTCGWLVYRKLHAPTVEVRPVEQIVPPVEPAPPTAATTVTPPPGPTLAKPPSGAQIVKPPVTKPPPERTGPKRKPVVTPKKPDDDVKPVF